MKIKIVDEISRENISAINDSLSTKESIEIDCMVAEKNRTVEEVLIMRTDRKARSIYAKKIFGFVKCYIIFVLIIFCIYEFILTPFSVYYHFYISTAPIIALLGSMSITVIGLLAGVVRYLFPNHRK